MRVIGWDSETFLIRPGMPVPKAVCLSYDDGESQDVIDDIEGLELFRRWIVDPDILLVGQSVVFDLCVMAAEDETLLKPIFAAIKAGRVRCTLLREKMIAIAKGELKYEFDEETGEWRAANFDLARLVSKRLGIWISKKEEYWRKRYGKLYRVPIAEWPEEAVKYSLLDSVICRQLYFHQQAEIEAESDGGAVDIPGEVAEVLAAFALGLMRAWGCRTHAPAVAVFEAEVNAEYEKHVAQALLCCPNDRCPHVVKKDGETYCPVHGLMRMEWKKDKGQPRRRVAAKTMAKLRHRVVEHFTKHHLDIPMTDPSKKHPHGQVKTDRETLTNLKDKGVAKDPALVSVAEVTRWGKLRTTYVPILKLGTEQPITADYNTPIDSYRTSCRKPNLQNGPRATAFRPCFVPRLRNTFAFCDLDTIEMRTLAQTCLDFFDYSVLADTINAGRDVHVALAAEMLNMSYEEASERYAREDPMLFGPQSSRQYAKIGNYGLAGGMGPDAFRDYARGYDIELDEGAAVNIHQGFRRTWIEMQDYFRFCGDLCGEGDAETIVHPRTGYVRGQVRYTATCNHFFQHLAAVAAKDALCVVSEEAYTIESSPLFGCRPWLYNHDEIGMEIPYVGERRASAALRLQTVMIDKVQARVPDVKIGASVAMARSWLKGAKPVYLDGVLMPARYDKPTKKWVPDIDESEMRAAA